MKKNFKYAILSAIALVGAVSFSACQSSEEVEDANPTYDGQAVKTQFTISLPDNVGKVTRQAVDIVQGQTTPEFRGLQDMILVPFASKPTASTAKAFSEEVALGDLTGSQLTSAANYHVYTDVTIPVGTSAFLFYGQAPYDALGFANGNTLRTEPTDNSAGYTFSPVPIFSGTAVDEKGSALAAYVSSIATAIASWASESNEGLKALYDNLVTLKAGSSLSVQAAVQDLYSSVRHNLDAVSQAAVTAITNATYVSAVDATTGALTFTEAISGYPGNIYLPDGAAALTWSGTTATAAVGNTSHDGLDVAGLTSYVYPASLWYRANTPIQTSTKEQTTKNSSNVQVYPDDYTTWDETTGTGILSLYDGSSVTPSTRSIVLENPINYAVGRLDLTIQCGAATLYDHKGEAVPITSTTFPVTAVLIGGQKAVDFEFTNPSGTEYTIYDNTMPSGMSASTTVSPVNYTLALETAQNTNVNVAVELRNDSGSDFFGYNGDIIPAGTKFYLIATLTASEATETNSRIFMQDYVTKAVLTINAGDPKSKTGFTENATGLGNAYNVIPDLRTPQLELGLSVDLTWETGHTFTLSMK